MPRYFMRDTPLQALEQLMMSQMWRANTARTMSASIRAVCVNAPAWRNGSKRVYWN